MPIRNNLLPKSNRTSFCASSLLHFAGPSLAVSQVFLLLIIRQAKCNPKLLFCISLPPPRLLKAILHFMCRHSSPIQSRRRSLLPAIFCQFSSEKLCIRWMGSGGPNHPIDRWWRCGHKSPCPGLYSSPTHTLLRSALYCWQSFVVSLLSSAPVNDNATIRPWLWFSQGHHGIERERERWKGASDQGKGNGGGGEKPRVRFVSNLISELRLYQ